MAVNGEWYLREDGCLSGVEPAVNVLYHPTLNTILVTTKEPSVKIIDVNSGSLLQKFNLCAHAGSDIWCTYLSDHDKVLFTDGYALAIRKDLTGVLLLDTVLQTPVSKSEDVVKVELLFAEAVQLFKCMMSTELPGVDFVEDVLKELKKKIDHCKQLTKGNHKLAKWSTVCLEQPHCALKSVCTALMQELKRLNRYVPGLPIASAISERLTLLLPSCQSDNSLTAGGVVDRALMYSEAARRDTFWNWPHMNYKWALPDQMAQAGFYHQPNSTGDDRAMCFTCNVCLVCWEPTDEPWSEHERHSPSCPFVKGEFTHNVPFSVTYATSPALLHGGKFDKINCLSTSTSDNYVATSTLQGNIVVWNVERQLKKCLQFNIEVPQHLNYKKVEESAKISDTIWKPRLIKSWGEPKQDISNNEHLSDDFRNITSNSICSERMLRWPLEIDAEDPLDTTERNYELFPPLSDICVGAVCLLGAPKAGFGSVSCSSKSAARVPLSLVAGVSIVKSVVVTNHSNGNSTISPDSFNQEVSWHDTLVHTSHNEIDDVDIPSITNYHTLLFVYDLSVSKQVFTEQKSISEPHSKKSSIESSSGSKKDMLYPTVVGNNFNDFYIPPVYEVFDDPLDLPMPVTFQSSTGKLCDPILGKEPATTLENGIAPEPVTKSSRETPILCPPPKIIGPQKARIMQYIELPQDIRYCKITSITPSVDGRFVLLTAEANSLDVNINHVETNGVEVDELKIVNSAVKDMYSKNIVQDNFVWGALLLFRISSNTDGITLDTQPTQKVYIHDKLKVITSVLMLPLDVKGGWDDDDYSNHSFHPDSDECGASGHFCVTTFGGSLEILELCSLRILNEHEAPELARFVSMSYCSGIERLCVCTDTGSLHFLEIGPSHIPYTKRKISFPEGPSTSKQTTTNKVDSKCYSDDDLLVNNPLTIEVLTALTELTKFENLLPRFSATTSPCWTEIQQEQKQRRHPQHLQQQGEALQHTRTWRLQTDSSTWDEHLFEITLPRLITVGHIDVKFTLQAMCSCPPNIQVTLLKQITGGLGRQTSDETPFSNRHSIEVDSIIDFNIGGQSGNAEKSMEQANPVLTADFLKEHNARILCGPVDLTSCIDLSGQSGIITLISPELLKTKGRTFLIHMKALLSEKDLQKNEANKVNNNPNNSNNNQTKKDEKRTGGPVKKEKSGVPSLQAMLDQYYALSNVLERTSVPNKKSDTLKGCDWIQEISITVRKTKKTRTSREKGERCAMLESRYFHEKLIRAVCDQTTIGDKPECLEHSQHLALDILNWITAIQMADTNKNLQEICILSSIQANLGNLITSCFIEAGRSVAHKCSRLIILCIEYAKLMNGADISHNFNYAVLQALKDGLPFITSIQSAGALRWFFLLLNRVKCMDISGTGDLCVDMLKFVSRHLNNRTHPLHSLLRARYGLYGTPFEPEIFDIEPPAMLKAASTPVTYASVITNNNNNNNNYCANVATTSQVQDFEPDFRDLLLMNSTNIASKGQEVILGQQIKGLLEVEPLHFTCSAASDGTKMEKLETVGSNLVGTSGLSALQPFPSVLLEGATMAAANIGASINTLTSTLFSAEQQLQLLQQKQQQLIKLQEQKVKLAHKLIENSDQSVPYSMDLLSHMNQNPYLMVPPLSPPNENSYIGTGESELKQEPQVMYKIKMSKSAAIKKELPVSAAAQPSVSISPPQQLLQPPPPQVLVIERMHSGARRFVVLDFGKPILLTDIIIPPCSDLVSLSIDIWTKGEEIDGERLAVSSDVGIRSVVISDLLPPPVCRFLKITTIGRYGMSTTRCRIPIGSFYGHTFLLPWELSAVSCEDPLTNSSIPTTGTGSRKTADTKSRMEAQLNILTTLYEDIQCRYSLACTRLESLLTSLENTKGSCAHIQYYLHKEKDKKQDDDSKINQAYQECIQLQLQLNLAQYAIKRLQNAQERQKSNYKNLDIGTILKQAPTDKLRVLTECLLDVLLGLINIWPSIPHVPSSLYSSFDQVTCNAFFKQLCISGTKRMQLKAAILLVQMCGMQPWWGQFLAKLLQKFFNSEQNLIFPQDRVFVLLASLGQKSLSNGNGTCVMESILNLLAQLLQPLTTNTVDFLRGSLDLFLIGWILLFLSGCLDSSNTQQFTIEENENNKNIKEKDTNVVSGRWDFIHGEAAMLKNRAAQSRSLSTRAYRRKLQKRLMHHKQQLLDLEHAKKNFISSQMDKTGASIEGINEVLMKQQEMIFKMQIKQRAAKHFKDILQIRRSDAPLLAKISKDKNGGNNGSTKSGIEREESESERDISVQLSREKCLPVVKGLIALLLAMDFTCNVDLFLIVCKVIARIANSTRPAIPLHDMLLPDQLKELMLLCIGSEFNNSSITWGGPWASHAIICLLLDVLEGERLYPYSLSTLSSTTEEDFSMIPSETDDTLLQSTTTPLSEDGDNASGTVTDASAMFFTETELITKLQDSVCAWKPFLVGKPPCAASDIVAPNKSFKLHYNVKNKDNSKGNPVMDLLFPSNSSAYQGISTSMDARLEYGVETNAEIRLKIMAALEADAIINAINTPLCIPPEMENSMDGEESSYFDDDAFLDARLSEADSGVSSLEILSDCFNQLLVQMHTLNLEATLQFWLTLNQESSYDDCNQGFFNSSRIPTIPLSSSSVTAIMNCLTWYPITSMRTWCLAFQTLTLLTNMKLSSSSDVDPLFDSSCWMASVILFNSSLVSILVRFLSEAAEIQNQPYCQVGPTATQAMRDFLVRLQLRCELPAGDMGHHFKEMLLKVIYILIAERGTFQSGRGPLDAQCKLLELILHIHYETVEPHFALDLIEAINSLVLTYIVSTQKVTCYSSTENNISASSCFGGLFVGMLRSSDSKSDAEWNRDILMSSLVRLVNMLVQLPLPSQESSHERSSSSLTDIIHDIPAEESITDSRKIEEQNYNSVIEDSDARTSQTDEHKTNTGSAPFSISKCIHAQGSPKTPCLADLVLDRPQIMHQLLSALSHCSGSTMAMLIGFSCLNISLSEKFTLGELVSVGDGILQILCTLNRKATDVKLVLRPLLRHCSSDVIGPGFSSILCQLSEPLLWFILRVLDCENALTFFQAMGGVEVICYNLVQSHHKVINTNPSLISTVMQYLGNSHPTNNNSWKKQTVDAESTDGLQNFAPLGTISSSNPTVQPADVLIQAAPPHRRARTAAWSYHFYPDEAWVDLTITLPCAILLKEVQIQPHLTSLATCPAAVCLEISADGSTMIPVCPPQPTSGLTFIKLQLQKPEVATAVCIRMHKPRDSSNIGLSQILLLGCTAFGESTIKKGLMFIPTEDSVAKSSMGWLRVLYHCLVLTNTQQQIISEAATSVPHLLQTCCALLLSPILSVYAAHLEIVLLKLGLHSSFMGLQLINTLLRTSGTPEEHEVSGSANARFNATPGDLVVDIMYQLCTAQDDGTAARIEAVAKWLEDVAYIALQKISSTRQSQSDSFLQQSLSSSDGLATPSPQYVQCAAAILWENHNMAITYNLETILTKDLFRSLYEWSESLTNKPAMKRAVDCVLCSMCYIRPELFQCLLEWMEILMPTEASTDDSKDAAGRHDSWTDDSKEANNSLDGFQPMILQDMCHLHLKASQLATLAVACQNPICIQQLLDLNFPAALAQALLEFCNTEISRQRSEQNESLPGTSRSSSHNNVCLPTDMVAPVLYFFAEICHEVLIKDWLGSENGNIFWPSLLNMLCNQPKLSVQPGSTQKTNRTLNGQLRASIETATILFLSRCTAGHPVNQHFLSQVLCDVIKGQVSTIQGESRVCNTPISGFTRRLVLQLVLEDERILVFIKSPVFLYKSRSSDMGCIVSHPRFGCGLKFSTIYVSMHTTCGDILKRVCDIPFMLSNMLNNKKDKQCEDTKKDLGELGLEFVDHLSVAAGVTAKDKRLKDAKSTSAPIMPPQRRGRSTLDRNIATTPIDVPELALTHHLLPGQQLPSKLTLSQLIVILQERGLPSGFPSIDLNVKMGGKKLCRGDSTRANSSKDLDVFNELSADAVSEEILLSKFQQPSMLQVFASIGGLAMLAEHLPLLYPEISRQAAPAFKVTNDKQDVPIITNFDLDWVKVESAEEFYEDYSEIMPASGNCPQSRSNTLPPPSIPPHSLAAFGLFLRLPGYAEVLLKERRKACCLLRLALGVTDDGEGGDIFASPMASTLPTLPFQVLQMLFDATPLTTDDSVVLRRKSLDIGVIHLVLACLSVLSHHGPRGSIAEFQHEFIIASTQAVNQENGTTSSSDDKSQLYWAKGTGFGTGSTLQSWDIEQAILRQRGEEEHVTCLLLVLSSYINPGGAVPKDFAAESHEPETGLQIPTVFPELLSQSCLIPAMCSYLRNDSVLDMARHVPLYRAVLQLLRALAIWPQLVPLFLPDEKYDNDESAVSISSLLITMKTCVDNYANRLKSNKGKNGTKSKEEEEEPEGLAQLIPDIQDTARIVEIATARFRAETDKEEKNRISRNFIPRTISLSTESKYIALMKELQFDVYEMAREDENGLKFLISHHYESNVRAAGDVSNPARARRLAQEAVTLSTSLPLSASSSVFVRCDEDRLDIMKVLITGPADTPYANGCYEFDVYFPPDYPNSPMLINLETTGHHTVRFNPNLYNDGKVCLSILNTWHGRPEEKWNPQTSSFLQVLVSIQSLILVAEPYFNEPGYERSRGTPSGTVSSREYDANIRQATVKWAMLEQIRNPPACFKEVIHKHFWLKRREIIQQCENWIAEMEVFNNDRRTARTVAVHTAVLKRHLNQLKEELSKLKSPSGLDEESICPSATTISCT